MANQTNFTTGIMPIHASAFEKHVQILRRQKFKMYLLVDHNETLLLSVSLLFAVANLSLELYYLLHFRVSEGSLGLHQLFSLIC